MSTRSSCLGATLNLYREAEEAVIQAGYGWEVEWQKNRSLYLFSEQDLLREAAWVILCSGFRESSVRKRFNFISLCFCDWEAAQEISLRRERCISTAMSSFRNEAKLHAIARVAEMIEEAGFAHIRQAIFVDPIRELQKFPFIGPITSWHLAKNLGLNVAKNDRHLSRLARELGYSDAHDLCGHISELTGQSRAVVDVTLWRFAVLEKR